MSISSVVRVLNLFQYLSAVDFPRGLEWIQKNVPGYSNHGREVQVESAYKQLRRDLSALVDLGVQVETQQRDELSLVDSSLENERGKMNKFRISGWGKPDHLSLNSEELPLLVALFKWKVENPAVHQQLVQAQLKLLGRGVTDAQSKIPQGTVPQGTVENFFDLDIDSIMRLYQSIDSGLCISFDYWHNLSAESQRRFLEPWAIAAVEGATYITGFDKSREAPRTFRLSRIAHVKIEEEIISHPAPAGITARELVNRGLQRSTVSPVVEFHRDRYPEEDYKVVEENIAETISESPYRVRLTAENREVYSRLLASYAPQVTVVEPQELRQDVIDILTQAYHNSGMPGDSLTPSTRTARGGE